jgi:hypothetical protein
MKICCECKREMRCDKNGVGADFGHGHVYAGDRFKCPQCGKMILVTNYSANFDREYKQQEEYLKINEGPIEHAERMEKGAAKDEGSGVSLAPKS